MAFKTSSFVIPAPNPISTALSKVIILSGEWVSVSITRSFPTSLAMFATCPFPKQWPFLALISKATSFFLAISASSRVISPG